MERKKTNKQYLIALFLHLWIFLGIFLGYFFAAFESFEAIIEKSEPFIPTIITLACFILISEFIIRFNFKSFRFVNHYSGTQYLVRRLIRSFFLNGAIFGLMFGTDLALFGPPIMILYYLLTTPLLFKFKQFTEDESKSLKNKL